MNTRGRIHKISISRAKGTKKNNIKNAIVVTDYGIAGDAHAGSERQISLLSFEAFNIVREVLPSIAPGDFAENITTEGVDYTGVDPGRRLQLGENVLLEITHIGKSCHHGCYIREQVGDCIMPRKGVFARVIIGGDIHEGDAATWVE